MSTEDIDLEDVVPVQTDDGSMTLHDTDRDVHYSSYHGASQESRHVFLEGTDIINHVGPWRIVELGFGAAVNFAHTLEAFRNTREALGLVYHTVDWRPVTPDHLEFQAGEAGQLARQAVEEAHETDQEVVTVESEDGKVALHLHVLPWDEVQLTGIGARAVYWDPFSKRVNPEAWSAEAFRRAKKTMETEGRLATYSAATSVKEAMFEAGFSVASAPGPGKKREMTVASPARTVLERDSRLEVLEREDYV